MIRGIALIDFTPALAAIAVLLVAGCDSNPTAGDVHGMVTLDGAPLEDGTIRFTPLEGKVGTAGGVIKGGQFSTTVPVARHRVEISAAKVVGGAEAAEARHSDANYTAIQLIPSKYNTKSELTLDVKSGLNEPRFDLKSR
jgi:hypothetical protein